ncbi:MAG: TonB-dependent receptor [Maribacter sp.]|nr:TonB-dependent receptor [Maribacter sp.]
MTFYIGTCQNSLTGTISDGADTSPLEQVEVYFPQLEKGAVTLEDGTFHIDKIPLGTYKVVASYLGYKTFSQSIEIKAGINTLDITLESSVIEMQEIIVSTPFHKLQSENVMKVEQTSMAEVKKTGAITLAEGITNIPGVQSASTGVSIGKPVIRGLSSNRVLVYTQGIRLENQQWGGEHGLGVSDAGIESVEVIKGPATLLYGSDAMGGVIYLNPEKFALPKTTEGDINFNYFSNTQGLGTNAGIKTSGDKFKFMARGSLTSHIDYKTGGDERVTNSRFREYDFKTGVGYQGTTYKTELRYNYNNLKLGIPEAIGLQSTDRTLELPFQTIDNHILSSKTNVFFEKSSLEATFGYIFNIRKEFGTQIDIAGLDMHLATLSYNVQYDLPKMGNIETILGLQGMHETNNNFGEEVLIPDATTNDIGVLGTSHVHFENESDLQLGLRYDHRAINGDESGVPGQESYIAPLDKNFGSFNASAGYKIDFVKNLVTRLNLATGFRAPNLAELTSNGVHEGTNRYEIGNAALKNEKNLQIDLAFEYSNQHIELYINGFYNTINDYIYIEPNGQFINSNAVFLYTQQDARLYGGEAGFHLHPHPLDWLHLESTFETVTGKLTSTDYLPLIPANSWTNTLRIEFDKNKDWIDRAYTFVTLKSIFSQNKVNVFETPSDGYSLLNIGLGGMVQILDKPVDVRISGNNILNKTYIDHLSRLKIDGIPNIGRNISVGVSVPL